MFRLGTNFREANRARLGLVKVVGGQLAFGGQLPLGGVLVNHWNDNPDSITLYL